MQDMSEHLLLIDDDMRLSAMVGDYLRSHGYQISSAPSLGRGETCWPGRRMTPSSSI